MDKEFVFSRIGMALISAQRVEFITKELIVLLSEFDKSIYGITSNEFLKACTKANKERITMGNIFRLLKLNPKLIIEEDLNEYLEKRNILVHNFWREYLSTTSDEQSKVAVNFCNEFGLLSDRIESFFKGFVYFLSLRHVKERIELNPNIQKWSDDFDYFILSLREQRLKNPT